MDNTPVKKKAGSKKNVNYDLIEAGWRAGLLSPRQLALAYTKETGQSVSHAAIIKRAQRDGWERDAPHRSVIQSEPVRLVEKDEMSAAGFVYVIYMEDSASERFYKIGMALSFTARFSAHRCASPFNLCVACAYFVGNMRDEESYLHALFADGRIRGEWFRLSEDDLETIAKRAKLV